ncbi:MAG: DUF3024 domain-containing protein [Bacillota bacterium]
MRRHAERLLTEFCEARVPLWVRDKYRLEFDVRGNSMTLYECRAPWRPGLTEWTRMSSAQFRFDPERLVWTLFYPDRLAGRGHC